MKRVIDAKHAFLNLAKIKYRSPEMRLNPHLIYLSRLDQMYFESIDEKIAAHRGVWW